MLPLRDIGAGGMRLDYTVMRGSDWSTMLDLEDYTGTPIDTDTSTVEFIVDDLFSKTAVDDVSTGESLVTITPADTEDAPDQRTAYRYNVKVTTAAGLVTYPQRGLFIVLPSIDSV